MAKLRILGSSTSQTTEREIAQVDPFTNPETVTINKELDGQKSLLFRGTLTPQGGPPPPPVNLPPVITTQTAVTGKANQEVTLTAKIVDPDGILEDVNWVQTGGPVEVTDVEEDLPNGIYTSKFTPPQAGTYTFDVIAFDTQDGRSSKRINITVDPIVIPPPTGNVLYDSLVNSKLHDGKERTIRSEGTIAPNGLGIECRASGNPRIKVNADKTFSLLCDKGHGRFYIYCLNYNATMEIECAFWNKVKGQDISLKMRSRHNESGKTCDGGSPITPNRFGGYGCSVDHSGWNAKREPTHNCHDQSKSGSYANPTVQKYFKLRLTVKDEGGKVRQIGEKDGVKFMDKLDDNPRSFMVDKALYDAQSYVWYRQNIEESKTGELRIKSLKITKA